MESKELAMQCAKILSDKIAQNLSVIYVREVTSLADYFVIVGQSQFLCSQTLHSDSPDYSILDPTQHQ